MILERYYKFQAELEKEKSDASPVQLPRRSLTKDEMERQDHLMALQLQRQESKDSRATTRAKPAKTSKTGKVTKRKSERKAPNTSFNSPMTLSPQLAELVGQTHMSRPQVVKQIWKYIKEHKIQDPEDGRKLNCDHKMLAVFKKKSVNMFEMNRILGQHLYKSDEILDGSAAAVEHAVNGDSDGQEEFEEEKVDVSKDQKTSKENHDSEVNSESSHKREEIAEPASSPKVSNKDIKQEEADISDISDVDD